MSDTTFSPSLHSLSLSLSLSPPPTCIQLQLHFNAPLITTPTQVVLALHASPLSMMNETLTRPDIVANYMVESLQQLKTR